MKLIIQARELLLSAALVVLALSVLFSLIRAIVGPRFTDRMMGINMIGTQTILILCILAFLMTDQSLVDIALVYALISFLAVVALVNIYLSMLHERLDRLRREESLMQSEHEIENQAVAQREALPRRDIEEAAEEGSVAVEEEGGSRK